MARSKYNILTLRNRTGLSQTNFARFYGIPLKTYPKWEISNRQPADYLCNALERCIEAYPVRGSLEIYRVELTMRSAEDSIITHQAIVKEAFRNPTVAANWAARIVRESPNCVGAMIYQDLGVADMLPLLEIEEDGNQKRLGKCSEFS